jgi:pre-mRNA-processing factor 40
MNMPNAMNIPQGHPQQQQQQYGGPSPQFPSYQSMGNRLMPNAQQMPLQQHTMQFQSQQQPIPQHPPPNMPSVAFNSSIVAANWSTHKAPTGADYFYNSSTGESTYTRPPCLGPDPAAVVPATTVKDNRKRGWTQHTDQSSGKVFYHDGTNTTWEKPDDFKDPSEESAKEPPSKKRKKKEENAQTLYSNKAEAVAAFKGLLLAKDISPIMKWNEVVKICSADHRWEACTTVGERKQALTEYQTKRANELREEKRQEKMRAKTAFMKLLTDILPSVSLFNASSNTPFQEIRDSLSKDDRFYAVEAEETREDLYRDFVEEIRKRDERLKRSRKREAKDSFISFLKAKEETGVLTFASTWQSFVSSLDDSDKVDSRFVVSPHMSDQARQLNFADHVLELQVLEQENTRRIREATRRAEKAQRDAFRDTITKYAKEGKILPSSRWRNVEEALTAEDSYGPVNYHGRNEPQNIFDDYVDEWIDVYHADKAFLNNLLLKSKELVVAIDSKYGDFTKGLLDAAAYSPEAYSDVRRIIKEELPVSSAKLFFDELVASRKAARTGPGAFSRRVADDSSDEGEIVEDGEVPDDNNAPAASTITQDTNEPRSEQ